MRILFAHKEPLPVKKYGGTERIIFWLMKELVRLGHHVTLIGHPNSQVQEFGIHLIQADPELKDLRPLIPAGTEVIHLFYAPPWPLDLPCLVTIEGNGQPGESFPLNTVFVSRHHASRHGSDQFVYNGLDLEEYPFRPQGPARWDHFLFLAKAKWKVKNLRHCIEACQKHKKHLHVAGGRAWTLSRYIHSYGMVDQLKKRQLLQKTDALLFPVRWPEPFGIAMIEAFAYGLPVIGSCYGSLPEVIAPHTGVLCPDYASFANCLAARPYPFQAEEIRHYVEEKFSVQKMAQDYLALYGRIIRGEKLNSHPPMYKGTNANETLLPF